MTSRGFLLASALFLTAAVCPSSAEETFYCEVMSVEGTVTLTNASASEKPVSEGDLLSADDVVSVGPSSYADLAYDRDWNNVTRVEENSSIRIRSLDPAVVELKEGGVFAKLKSLPKESTFDVQTPTAIASVRGTEYRTTYTNGETQVYNVSDSDVYVYGVDSAGKQQAEPVVIRNTQVTSIQKRGEAPRAPRPMESHEIAGAAKFQRGIEQQVMRNIDRGRIGKLPDVGTLEKRIQERRQQGGGQEGVNKALRSNEGGPSGPGGADRAGQPKTLSGEDAHRMASQQGNKEGSENKQEIRGGGFVSGEGMKQRGPGTAPSGENRFEGRGLSEPFFPGDERSRSGGPQPTGLPDRRWKTGGDDPKNSGPLDKGGVQGPPAHQGEHKQGMGQPQHQEGGQPQGKQPQGGKAGGGARPQPRRT